MTQRNNTHAAAKNKPGAKAPTPHERLGFRSREAAARHIRDVLNATALHGTVTDAATLACLALHRSYAAKSGTGVRRVFVDVMPPWNTRCFWLERTDGTSTDISYLECLKPSTHPDQVLHALRCAIRDDLESVRDVFPPGCAMCSGPGEHIDHAEPTFSRMASAWVEAVGGYTAVALLPSADADGITRLADSAVHESWLAYHREHCRLQLLCAACNLSKGAR